MPNHCTNYLQVDGTAEDVKSFMDAVSVPTTHDEEYQICRTLLPLPEDAHKTIDGGTVSVFSDTGYDTALRLWGTKWGDYDVQLLESSNPLSANFFYLTAWSPMTEALVSISQMYPNLTFRQAYIEEGCGFCGGEVIQNGEIKIHCDISLSDYPVIDDEGTFDKYHEWYEEKIDAAQAAVGM